MILTSAELIEMDIQASYWRANLMNVYFQLNILNTLYETEDDDPYLLAKLMEGRRKLRHND